MNYFFMAPILFINNKCKKERKRAL